MGVPKQITKKNRPRLDMALTQKDESILTALEKHTGLKRAGALRLAIREAAERRSISLEPEAPQPVTTVVAHNPEVGILKWSIHKSGLSITEPWPVCVLWETSERYSGCYATSATDFGWRIPVQVEKADAHLFDTEVEAETYWRSLPGGASFQRTINWVIESNRLL